MSNDDYAYDQTPLMFDYSQLGDGQPEMDPYLLAMIQSMMQPPLDKNGNPEPIDLSVQNQLQTGLQSRYRTLFDMGNSALTGGFSPGAFQPDVSEKQLDFPKTGSLQVQAQAGGYQGQLARLILRGMSPAQAAATIRDTIENQPDNVSDDERNDLMMGLPTTWDQNKLEDVVDWNAVQKEAASLATPYYEEQGIRERAMMPDSGIIQRNGKFYETTETPSAATQWFQKQGLDTPGTQYDEDYLRRTSGFGDIEQALQQNFGNLLSERGTYAGNEALRKRNADLERQFTSQDRGAMDRFSRGVQNAMGDYGRQINSDNLTIPAWGGGQHVGDPTVEPMLGQRTGTQVGRDRVLQLAMLNPQTGGPSADPAQIQEALRNYMSSASREPMTDVAGHPGGLMVGSAGRGPGGGGGAPSAGPGFVDEEHPVANLLPQFANQPQPGRSPQRNFGEAVMPNLPGLPQLSAYSDPNQQARTAMAVQLLGRMPMMGGLAARAQRGAEQSGKLRPQGPKTSKQQDANRRTDAYKRTQAAQWAYAQQLLAADMARKAGHTPFGDQIAARTQSMYGVGSMG